MAKVREVSEDTNVAVSENKPKRSRAPSQPKNVFVVYRTNEATNDIEVVKLTRKAEDVIELITEDSTLRMYKGTL